MFRSNKIPPGPGWPALIQLVNWIVRPVDFIRQCQAKYGETYTMRFPHYPPIVVISDPQKIKQVFSGDTETFQSGMANRLLKTSLGQDSIIVLDGEEHMRLRRLMQGPLHGERMKAYRDTMYAACEQVASTWPEKAEFPLYSQTQAITLKVIIENIFGIQGGDQFALIERHATAIMQMFANPWGLLFATFDGRLRFSWLMRLFGPLSPVRWMQNKINHLDQILYEQIARKRQLDSEDGDILSLLLALKDEKGNSLSDQEIRDQLVTLLMAGHETTATSICWTIFHLLSNELIMAKLLGQLRENHWSEETPYLDAVIRESLRLSPVVPMVVRYVNRSVTLKDLSLPQGVIVAANLFMVHYNPDLYEDPARFNPDRMVDKKSPAYEYFPFGGGIRHCIGWAFSTYEMKIVLSYLLRHYTLRLKPGYKMKVARRGIGLLPSKGLPLIMQKKVG